MNPSYRFICYTFLLIHAVNSCACCNPQNSRAWTQDLLPSERLCFVCRGRLSVLVMTWVWSISPPKKRPPQKPWFSGGFTHMWDHFRGLGGWEYLGWPSSDTEFLAVNMRWKILPAGVSEESKLNMDCKTNRHYEQTEAVELTSDTENQLTTDSYGIE